jgi:hypothetical protein
MTHGSGLGEALGTPRSARHVQESIRRKVSHPRAEFFGRKLTLAMVEERPSKPIRKDVRVPVGIRARLFDVLVLIPADWILLAA